MGRQMVASLILRLRDLVSPGLGAIQRRIQSLRDAAGRIGAIGAVVAGISFMAPIRDAAAFDQRLRDIAITAGRTGAAVEEMIASQRSAFRQMAQETAQRAGAIVDANAVMVASGMESTLADRLLPVIARGATAANANMADLARTAFTLSSTLRVPAEQMDGALASLVISGREGRFELRAMAQEIPRLAAPFAALGSTGRAAVNDIGAMLQVAMRTAGSESEAANNLRQFVSRLSSPDFLRAANEAGLRVTEVMARAVQQGVNPVEAAVQHISQFTGGDMARIGRLFTEEQSRAFYLAMIQNRREFLRIQEAARHAGPAVIDQAFDDQWRGPAQELARLLDRIEGFGDRIGGAFASNLRPLNDFLGRLESGIAWIDERFPGAIDQALALAGAGIVLVGALGAIGFAAPAVMAGLGLIGGAIRALRLVLLTLLGPWGLVAAAAITAVVLIYEHWETVAPWFAALWRDVRQGFDDFTTWLATWTSGALAGAVGAIRAAWSPLAEFFGGLLDGIAARFAALRDAIQPILDAAARLFGAPAGEGPVSDPAGQADRRQRMGQRGAAGGFYADPVTPAAPGMRGEIVVRAAPGTTVERAESGNRQVPMTIAPNRGPMLGTP